MDKNNIPMGINNFLFLGKMRMSEYRCTRNAPYSNPNCFGHKDLSARQGYYIEAPSAESALRKMAQMFPQDNGNFTCQHWKDL